MSQRREQLPNHVAPVRFNNEPLGSDPVVAQEEFQKVTTGERRVMGILTPDQQVNWAVVGANENYSRDHLAVISGNKDRVRGRFSLSYSELLETVNLSVVATSYEDLVALSRFCVERVVVDKPVLLHGVEDHQDIARRKHHFVGYVNDDIRSQLTSR